MEAKFLRTIEVRVSDDDKWVFLTQHSGHIYINDLNRGMTVEASLTQLFSGQSGLKTKISAPKRISEAKYQELQKAKAIFPHPISVIGQGSHSEVRVHIPLSPI